MKSHISHFCLLKLSVSEKYSASLLLDSNDVYIIDIIKKEIVQGQLGKNTEHSHHQ